MIIDKRYIIIFINLLILNFKIGEIVGSSVKNLPEITNTWYVLAIHDYLNWIPNKIQCWTIELSRSSQLFDFRGNYTFHHVMKKKDMNGGVMFDSPDVVDNHERYTVPSAIGFDFIVLREALDDELELWDVSMADVRSTRPFCTFIVSLDPNMYYERRLIIDKKLPAAISYVDTSTCPSPPLPPLIRRPLEVANKWYVLAYVDYVDKFPEEIRCWTIEVSRRDSIFYYQAKHIFHDVKRNDVVQGIVMFDHATEVDGRLRHIIPTMNIDNDDYIVDRKRLNTDSLELWNVDINQISGKRKLWSFIVSFNPQLSDEEIEIVNENLVGNIMYVDNTECPIDIDDRTHV